MKVKVGIIRKQYYCGEVEMTEEKYDEYMSMESKNLISCMLLKKAVRKGEENYFVYCFKKS